MEISSASSDRVRISPLWRAPISFEETDVLADDGSGYVDDLVGAGVDLDEALGRRVVRCMTDDGLAGA